MSFARQKPSKSQRPGDRFVETVNHNDWTRLYCGFGCRQRDRVRSVVVVGRRREKGRARRPLSGRWRSGPSLFSVDSATVTLKPTAAETVRSSPPHNNGPGKIRTFYFLRKYFLFFPNKTKNGFRKAIKFYRDRVLRMKCSCFFHVAARRIDRVVYPCRVLCRPEIGNRGSTRRYPVTGSTWA